MKNGVYIGIVWLLFGAMITVISLIVGCLVGYTSLESIAYMISQTYTTFQNPTIVFITLAILIYAAVINTAGRIRRHQLTKLDITFMVIVIFAMVVRFGNFLYHVAVGFDWIEIILFILPIAGLATIVLIVGACLATGMEYITGAR